MVDTETLAKIEGHPGKPVYSVIRFFQRMISSGDLNAYSIEGSREEVVSDTGEKRVVRTIKGPILTSVERIRDNQRFVLETPTTGIKYVLSTYSVGGMLDSDGENTISHTSLVRRLSENVGSRKTGDGLLILTAPHEGGEAYDAKLRISYATGLFPNSGEFTLEGETDILFYETMAFLRT